MGLCWQIQQDGPDFHPFWSFSALCGESHSSPRIHDIYLSSVFWVYHGVFYYWLCLDKASNRRCPEDLPIRCPNTLDWLLSIWRSSSSTPSSLWISQSYREGWACPPFGGNSFQIFMMLFFWSLLRGYDHRWGLGCRLTNFLGSASPPAPALLWLIQS